MLSETEGALSGDDGERTSRLLSEETESLLIVGGERPLSSGEEQEYGTSTTSADKNVSRETSHSPNRPDTSSHGTLSGGENPPASQGGSVSGGNEKPDESSLPSGNRPLLPIHFSVSPDSLLLKPNEPKTVTLQMNPANCIVTASGYAGITIVQNGRQLTITASNATREEGSLILTANKDGYVPASTRISIKVSKPLDPTEAADLTDRLYIAINKARSDHGVPPFSRICSLDRGAQTRAEEISISFSSNRPNGTAFYTVYTPGPNYNYGENIAMGYQTPEEALTGWMSSPGQRDNILDENYTGIGLGVYKDGHGRWFWVEHFYRP